VRVFDSTREVINEGPDSVTAQLSSCPARRIEARAGFRAAGAVVVGSE